MVSEGLLSLWKRFAKSYFLDIQASGIVWNGDGAASCIVVYSLLLRRLAGAHGFAGDLTLAGTGIELRGEVKWINAAFEDEEEVVRVIDERNFFDDESNTTSVRCSIISVCLD